MYSKFLLDLKIASEHDYYQLGLELNRAKVYFGNLGVADKSIASHCVPITDVKDAIEVCCMAVDISFQGQVSELYGLTYGSISMSSITSR